MHWYFIHFYRYIAGMHEYEVELQLSSRLLGYSDHLYWNRDSSVTVGNTAVTDTPQVSFHSATNESSSEEVSSG